MVVGVDRFREHFAGFDHQYVLIGGAACELLMGDVGLDFRATKDRERSEGQRVLYRFQKPTTPDFPAMLELFSRTPPGLSIAEGSQLTPLPISEEAASLSAILLDEDYYAFLKSMVRSVDGIPVLGEAALIPFKARAWVDLSARRAAGEQVDERDVKKHRNDVARLLQLLSADARHPLPRRVHADMETFVTALEAAEEFDPKQFKVDMARNTVIERLRSAYDL